MGFHCSDCAYSTFVRLTGDTTQVQGACSRGYTLCNPKISTSPANRFAQNPDELVPTIDPFGNEYLRTSNVCKGFENSGEKPRFVSIEDFRLVERKHSER